LPVPWIILIAIIVQPNYVADGSSTSFQAQVRTSAYDPTPGHRKLGNPSADNATAARRNQPPGAPTATERCPAMILSAARLNGDFFLPSSPRVAAWTVPSSLGQRIHVRRPTHG
jgi:hypothetical protein